MLPLGGGLAPLQRPRRAVHFAIQYQPLNNPEWIEDVPYVTAVVELEEGVRMFTLLVECEPDPEKIRCGMPVEMVFDPVSEEVTIPRFRPLKEAQ